jgi:glycosyltransferase involved in cell wall biosynthesis
MAMDKKTARKKRVAIIGTVGIPAKYGGFETLAHHLVRQLNDQYELRVYCSSKSYPKAERQTSFNGAKLTYVPLNANGIQSIPYDILSLLHAVFCSDILLVLGVSGGIILPLIRWFTKRKIIVNIDGLEWRRDKWGKYAKKFLKFSEIMAVKYSHADITDNASIKRYTSQYYNTLSTLIAYGGDHVQKGRKPDSKDLEKYPFLSDFYAFKVARIEPENNVHLILEGFSTSKWPLVVVGNWKQSEYGRNLVEKYSKFENISLLDAIYEQSELDLIRGNCSVYIHGHSAGGTNPSLVEAMNLELPVFAFDCSFNRATTDDKAHYFKSAEQLVELLKVIDRNMLLANAKAMSFLAAKMYTWKGIAKKYANIIESFEYRYTKQPLAAKSTDVAYKELLDVEAAHLKSPIYYFEK